MKLSLHSPGTSLPLNSAIKYRLLKARVTRCNFSCNLQRSSTLKRCKLVTNAWYVENILANCDETCIANFTSPKSRIALQVARKIALSDRAFSLGKPICCNIKTCFAAIYEQNN